MDRRDSIKSLLVGGLAGGMILTGCDTSADENTLSETSQPSEYGRTEDEKLRDARLKTESFLTDQELGTIAVLCDLILPATEAAGSATDARVPECVVCIV
jgi:hypothetical protein